MLALALIVALSPIGSGSHGTLPVAHATTSVVVDTSTTESASSEASLSVRAAHDTTEHSLDASPKPWCRNQYHVQARHQASAVLFLAAAAWGARFLLMGTPWNNNNKYVVPWKPPQRPDPDLVVDGDGSDTTGTTGSNQRNNSNSTLLDSATRQPTSKSKQEQEQKHELMHRVLAQVQERYKLRAEALQRKRQHQEHRQIIKRHDDSTQIRFEEQDEEQRQQWLLWKQQQVWESKRQLVNSLAEKAAALKKKNTNNTHATDDNGDDDNASGDDANNDQSNAPASSLPTQFVAPPLEVTAIMDQQEAPKSTLSPNDNDDAGDTDNANDLNQHDILAELNPNVEVAHVDHDENSGDCPVDKNSNRSEVVSQERPSLGTINIGRSILAQPQKTRDELLRRTLLTHRLELDRKQARTLPHHVASAASTVEERLRRKLLQYRLELDQNQQGRSQNVASTTTAEERVGDAVMEPDHEAHQLLATPMPLEMTNNIKDSQEGDSFLQGGHTLDNPMTASVTVEANGHHTTNNNHQVIQQERDQRKLLEARLAMEGKATSRRNGAKEEQRQRNLLEARLELEAKATTQSQSTRHHRTPPQEQEQRELLEASLVTEEHEDMIKKASNGEDSRRKLLGNRLTARPFILRQRSIEDSGCEGGPFQHTSQ